CAQRWKQPPTGSSTRASPTGRSNTWSWPLQRRPTWGRSRRSGSPRCSARRRARGSRSGPWIGSSRATSRRATHTTPRPSASGRATRRSVMCSAARWPTCGCSGWGRWRSGATWWAGPPRGRSRASSPRRSRP
ncbi:MAG: hypothetical protein AVDCRST_MAG40-2849, partial [uncultured Gemmatimonadaceae bacterium]